jgi:hypothetical protein
MKSEMKSESQNQCCYAARSIVSNQDRKYNDFVARAHVESPWI